MASGEPRRRSGERIDKRSGLAAASSPLSARRLLIQYGLRPKKSLGQNFLIDRNVLERIVEASEAAPGSNVLEIGAGLGAVSKGLLDRGARVVCIEFDPRLLPILQQTLQGHQSAEIVIGDFLKIDLPDFLRSRADGRWTVVGNLPYYITSPIITRLLESRALFSSMLLMVQREVAERLKSDAGTEGYGALTVFTQFYCDVESIMRVSRNVFYPVPEVDSELVKLTVRDTPRVKVAQEDLFFRIVRAAFGKRRKTLENALSSASGLGWDKSRARSILAAAGIDPGRRGETLSMEEFAGIANAAAGFDTEHPR